MGKNKVSEVKNVNEFKDLTDKGAAVVKYSAQWCGPCIRIAPHYKELAASNKNINFLHVDIDEAQETLPNQVSNIFSVPTFHYMLDGEVVDKQEGANLVVLKEKVTKLKAKLEESEKKPAIPAPAIPEKMNSKKKEDKESKTKEEEAKDTPKSSDSSKEEEKGKVIEVSDALAFNKFTSTGKCVFDFSASWCMPCKILMPVYTKLAADYPEVQFCKIDVDEVDEDLDDIISNLKIVAVPSFLYYNNGKLVDRMSGGNPEGLKSKVETLSKTVEEETTEEKTEDKTEEPASKEESPVEEKNEESEEKAAAPEEVEESEESVKETTEKEEDHDAIEAEETPEKTPETTEEKKSTEKEEEKKEEEKEETKKD